MIAIVDYKAGNLTSVKLALAEVGEDAVISSDPVILAGADRLIFPGVGAAGSAMAEIRNLGLETALKAFLDSGRPFLGICVGCQIIMDWSLEDGRTPCLGFLPGGTDIFRAAPGAGVKVPHMGWNQVRFARPHPVLEGIPSGADFYFVHSYFPQPAEPAHVLAETEYGGAAFASVLGRGNLVACQFHVEKSGKRGLRLLENFCKWDGRDDRSTWDGRDDRSTGDGKS
jgi:glutamine amidotransferase